MQHNHVRDVIALDKHFQIRPAANIAGLADFYCVEIFGAVLVA